MFLRKLAVASCVCGLLAASLESAQDANTPKTNRTQTTQRNTGDPLPFGLTRPSSSSRITLTNVTKVQEELGLTEAQKQQLSVLRKTASEKQRELFAELQKRSVELNQQAEEAAKKLLDEKQSARMDQLRLQREGVTALSWHEVVEELGLDAGQRDKLTNLALEYRRTALFADSPGRGGPNPATSQPAVAAPEATDSRRSATRSRENRDQIAANMIAVLTPEQKTKWEEMQGSKFEFPAPQFPATGAPSSVTGFQRSIRARPFELGQYRSTTRTPSMRLIVQMFGPTGPFRYQSAVEALGLTEDQKTQIRNIGAEDVKAFEQIGDSQGPDSSDQIDSINKATQQRLDTALTGEQNAKLKELLSR